MLDPRIYRAAFVPVLLAILVVAFSLQARPRAIGTTLAPDAFDGSVAFATLGEYVQRFGVRRPGDRDDTRLAKRIARDLSVLGRGTVRTFRASGQTIDGERELTTVVATRPGRPGPGLVVVAHRDAAGAPAEAELSGTAALAELARVAAAGRLRRTVSFVSTSGGSGGLAGAREAIKRLPQPVNAVLVLGDLASRTVHKPWVVGWSNGGGSAPLRLRRTLEAAVRAETGQDAGGPRARAQWARLAFPMTVSEQGAFAEAGEASVLLSATGELPPDAGAPVDERRMTVFGRAALRTIFALDNGPDIASGPEELLVTQRKVLPYWAVMLLVGAALLPVWLAVLDALARVRRRKLSVGAGLRWVLASSLPFVAVALFAVMLGVTGLIGERPAAPAPAGAVPADSTAAGVVAALVLVFALGWIGLRPVASGSPAARAPLGDGHAAAALGVLALASFVVWLANPFAAALLVLPAHAWLLAVAPEVRLPRIAAGAVGLLALLPVALVCSSLARQLGYGPREAGWSLVLMVSGGHVGPLVWLMWSVVAGAAVCVGMLVLHRPPAQGGRVPAAARGAAVRGPRTYAGPGSLGGTDSALRR
ncbi:MAG: M28 family peptidase [Actinomycetota bacterium]|nr:M28 family peptidase [Actinomycetota bacterium]